VWSDAASASTATTTHADIVWRFTLLPARDDFEDFHTLTPTLIRLDCIIKRVDFQYCQQRRQAVLEGGGQREKRRQPKRTNWSSIGRFGITTGKWTTRAVHSRGRWPTYTGLDPECLVRTAVLLFKHVCRAWISSPRLGDVGPKSYHWCTHSGLWLFRLNDDKR
jgi:hypothetical protein